MHKDNHLWFHIPDGHETAEERASALTTISNPETSDGINHSNPLLNRHKPFLVQNGNKTSNHSKETQL